MKLDARHIILTLQGTPSEFAGIIGFPDYDNIQDLKAALGRLTENTALATPSILELWELSGTWKDFAEFIGYPEAVSLEDFLNAFQRLHPRVTVVR